MKIRKGFVSNSSSSSFCIFGTEVEEDQLKALAEKLGVSVEDDDYFDTWKLDEALKAKGHIVHVENMNGEYFWIGKSWSSIGEDVTAKDFKAKVTNEVKELLGEEISCSTCEEGWYDG